MVAGWHYFLQYIMINARFLVSGLGAFPNTLVYSVNLRHFDNGHERLLVRYTLIAELKLGLHEN